MKLAALLVLLASTSCAAVRGGALQAQQAPDAPPPAATWHANRIALYVGQRSFDEDDFEPVEDQPMLGLEYGHEPIGSVVGFELGLMVSEDDDELGGFDVEARTGELYAGVRKTFGHQSVHPYLGGGLSMLEAEVEVDGLGDDDDTSMGLYLHGGVAFDVTEVFSLGIDLRALFGTELELAGVEGDADYMQFALTAGFAF